MRADDIHFWKAMLRLPWTYSLVHADDVERGTLCTWVRHDNGEPWRPGVVTDVERDEQGRILGITAREFAEEREAIFEVAHELGHVPHCGDWVLVLGWQVTPSDNANVEYGEDTREEVRAILRHEWKP